jgi:hypothetical protein
VEIQNEVLLYNEKYLFLQQNSTKILNKKYEYSYEIQHEVWLYTKNISSTKFHKNIKEEIFI